MSRLLANFREIIENVNSVFAEVGIYQDELTQLDHLCYRTETIEEYHEVVRELEGLGMNLGEVLIEQRPISVIELQSPLKAGGWTVDYLEIAAPKASSPYPSGLEHAEFVTRERLAVFEARHADLPFKRDAMGKTINPEIKYRDRGISVKFHQLSIAAAMNIESGGRLPAPRLAG